MAANARIMRRPRLEQNHAVRTVAAGNPWRATRTAQARDLGGFGKASGGSPDGGRSCGMTNGTDVRNNSTQIRSGASAAPQQAIPAEPPQQWLAQSKAALPIAPAASAARAVLSEAVSAVVGAASACLWACGGAGVTAFATAGAWCAWPSCATASDGIANAAIMTIAASK